MFKKHYQKRSPNILFIIFRLALSMAMLSILLVGVYSAYKSFSGVNPLKLDPQQLIEILSSLKIGSKTLPLAQVLGKSAVPPAELTPAFGFLLVADSHSDNNDLDKAITQAKAAYPDLKFIIGLGDYTKVGTLQELKDTKKILDNSGLTYFLLAGEHDLWDSRDKQVSATANFNQVFGPTFQSFDYDNFHFLLIDNSDDYKGLGDTQLKWIEEDLNKAKSASLKGIFAFLHQPLFHPVSDRVMGQVEKDLKQQARDLMYQFKSAGIKIVFAGDIHLFSQYKEPVTGIEMATIGAITIERNPQAPRYAVVFVFEDGFIKVEDIEIK